MLKHYRLFFLLVALGLGGCATYGQGVTSAVQDLQKGDYAASEAGFKKALKPDGDDRLLYNLELAVVKHLEGDFNASNDYLETAQKIAEDLETVYMNDTVKAMMSNPRQSPYPGADFERVFINYYKALNYFGLAQQATSTDARETALENANIEARRLIIRLNDLNARQGNYKAENEEEGTFTKLMKIFSLLNGNLIDMDAIKYRDDAMAHYLAGLSFEMSGEFDDARISYQKAAESYDRGYTKQYRLDKDMGAQAWFDVVRMMRKTRDFDGEWQNLAKKKLSKEQQAELNKWDDKKAQLVVLEHKGIAPQRKEMNLILSVDPAKRALALTPVGFTSDSYALAWFYLLYADKGILDAVANYLDATEVGYMLSSFTKTVGMGPAFDTAQQIGLLDAISSGLRVTVPYYEPVKALGESDLSVDGHNYKMLKSSNPALMGIQEQMTRAGMDINMALARAAVKALAADQLKHAGGNAGLLLSFAGKLTMQAIDAAETRNWLLLPQDIRVRRVLVEPGEHQLKLSSQMPSGTHYNTKNVTLNAGDIHLWRVRVLPPVQDPKAKKSATGELLQTTATN